jgi:membrane protein
VIGFMTWIWISAMVILMGAEVNAEIEEESERRGLRPIRVAPR